MRSIFLLIFTNKYTLSNNHNILMYKYEKLSIAEGDYKLSL